MAKDREQKSEVEPRGEAERDGHLEGIEEGEAEADEASFANPFCPRCGWHNTRPSHTSTLGDSVLRLFGLRPYRCRSCGNRFRAIRRIQKSDSEPRP